MAFNQTAKLHVCILQRGVWEAAGGKTGRVPAMLQRPQRRHGQLPHAVHAQARNAGIAGQRTVLIVRLRSADRPHDVG